MTTDFPPRIIPKRKLGDETVIAYVQQDVDLHDATTTRKGIAKFNTENFMVTAGAVNLILDDTPVSGETDEPITSNWAYQHTVTASAHHAKYTDANARTAVVQDTAYSGDWNNLNIVSPSKNAVYDKINAMDITIAALQVKVKFASGTYTGNDGTNRQITTGFQCKLVIVYNDTDAEFAVTWSTSINFAWDENTVLSNANPTFRLHATNGFYVHFTGATPGDTNDAGDTYYYFAIGE